MMSYVEMRRDVRGGGVVCLVAKRVFLFSCRGEGKKEKDGKGGSGYILTITDRITDIMFLSVNLSAILLV